MTLMDVMHNINKKYIGFSFAKDIPQSDKDVFRASDYDTEGKKWSSDKTLSPLKRRELALTAPFFMKASKKKNMDKIRAWFNLVNENTGNPLTAIDKVIINHFDKKTNIKYKWLIANICADIYGDGLILKKYENDVIIRDKNGERPDVSKPVPDDAKFANIELINPEYFKEIKYLNKSYEKIGIQHYYYHNTKSGLELYIHPDRIIHIKDDELPFSKQGISKVDMLINIISSEAEIDEAVGRILKWFSHGIVEYKKTGMQPNERKEMLKILAQHPDFFAHNEKYELDVHNPEAINPKPFFDYIVLAISSTFNMPSQVLVGVQIGKVTGAETGYSDYYRDIKDKQELIDSPKIIDLYTELLKGKGREFKYIPEWNDIYVGELAEAEMLGKRAATIQLLINAGVITKNEARDMLNKGQIYLKQLPEDNESEEPNDKQNTIIKPENPKEKETKWNDYQEMIEKRKILRQAEKEKKLGEEILKNQDELFGENGKAFKSDKETFGK